MAEKRIVLLDIDKPAEIESGRYMLHNGGLLVSFDQSEVFPTGVTFNIPWGNLLAINGMFQFMHKGTPLFQLYTDWTQNMIGIALKETNTFIPPAVNPDLLQ